MPTKGHTPDSDAEIRAPRRAKSPAYAEISDVDWNDAAAATWKGEMRPNGKDWEEFHASGRCPRCGDEFHTRLTQDVVIAIEPGEAAGRVLPGLKACQFTFLCECGEAHKGRPDGRSGCGAAWNIIAMWEPTTDRVARAILLPGRASDWEDRQDAISRRELTKTELQRVRDAADKWKTGLAALLGLIATVSVVKGRDSISALAVGTQHVIIGILGGALALAGIAALLAMRAAYGPLERRSLNNTTVHALRSAEIRKALNHLRIARALTVVVLGLLALAVGLAWWGEEPTPGRVSVRLVDKTTLCGGFRGATVDEIQIETQPGTTVFVPLRTVRKVEFVQEC